MVGAMDASNMVKATWQTKKDGNAIVFRNAPDRSKLGQAVQSFFFLHEWERHELNMNYVSYRLLCACPELRWNVEAELFCLI